MGYALPLGLTALVYSGGDWLAGLGRFSPADLASALNSSYGIALNSGPTLVPISFAVTATVFVALGALTAVGEEVGWRGFLVPQLARSASFHRVALIGGGMCAAWHAPLIVLADDKAGTSAWHSAASFSATVVSVGVVSARLRLHSGSVWPAVLLHASHNAFIQTFFDPQQPARGSRPKSPRSSAWVWRWAGLASRRVSGGDSRRRRAKYGRLQASDR